MNNETADHGQAATTPDLERIMNDFASLKRDFADLLGYLGSGAFNDAGDAAAAVRSLVGRLGAKTGSVYDGLAAQRERSVKAIGRQVEEQPVVSLLIAFGAGFLAGRLLSR